MTTTRNIKWTLLCLFASVFTIYSQVGIGTTDPRGTLEIQELSEDTEAPITIFSAYNRRTMSILQPDLSDNNDFFTFSTNNAFLFRTDSTDALSIDENGDVGINTTNPQANLHLGGASSRLRLDYLNSTNSIFNNGIDAAVLMIDGNGDLFLKENVDDFPINDTDEGTFFNTPIALEDPTGVTVGTIAYTTTITLTKKTLIEIVFYVGVVVRNFSGALPLDQKPRMYGGIVTHQGTNSDIIYSASSHTNALINVVDTGDVNLGYYTIGGNGFITLDPGVHTFDLNVFAGGGTSIITPIIPAEGYQVTFGGNSISRFQLVYHN